MVIIELEETRNERANLSDSDRIASVTILLVSNHFSNTYIFVKTRSKIVMYDR